MMPNADCRDLVVNVNQVEFGRTVRDIYVDFYGRWKQTDCDGFHERYMREARERGEQTYVDLTDVAHFPELRSGIEAELQRRLRLLYTPRLHVLGHLECLAEHPSSLTNESSKRDAE